jgi:electron transport complex protein RnfA
MTFLLLVLMSTMLVNVFVIAGAPLARGSKDRQGRWGEELSVAAFGALMLFAAAIGAYAVEHVVLRPAHIEYLRTVAFLGLIAVLTPLARTLTHAVTPTANIASIRLIEALTNNAAFLGIALFAALHVKSIDAAIELGLGSAVGFAFAVAAFASMRERIGGPDVPRALRGPPIALITAGIMALALLGLSGLVKV